MTDGDGTEEEVLMKTDVLGRVRTTPEQREALLDAFEAGALSGPDFARVHGINYQTFATWRQKRKRSRGDGPKGTPEPPVSSFTLIEAQLPKAGAPVTGPDGGVVIEWGEGLKLSLTTQTQVPLAVAFLQSWKTCSGC